ncbi:hypothetical protein [Insolitispirillum peregrinum]|uniref:hypothetical protein n=1 Tax=Insolitispirillum peregrinum TaxID=80876 RepID=UPI00361FC136
MSHSDAGNAGYGDAAVIDLAARREQRAIEREVAEILALAATVGAQLAALEVEQVFAFSADLIGMQGRAGAVAQVVALRP